MKDASITVNSVDLSTRCDEVTVEDEADETEVSSFGGNGYKEYLPGLKDGSITASFYQDFASGSVHSTLNPLYQNGTTFTVVVKATSAAVSATNPSFTLSAKLYSYSPVGGSISDPAKTECVFRNAGNGITVATS